MLACTHCGAVPPTGSHIMRCPECEHENTEGAWLCINCGAKLPRPETEAQDDAEHEREHEAGSGSAGETTSEEPSRFAPRISENLRRLRDQTEHDRARTTPRAAGANLLGIPLVAWAVVVFVIIVFVVLVSSLQ